MEQEYLGIIVSSIEHKEKNQIVQVYTQEGYLSVYVRGAKDFSKGKMSFCMPYTIVSFKAKGKDIKSLISYEVIESNTHIRNDYYKSLYVYAMLFLLKTPHEEMYDRRIFDFLLKIFNKMRTISPDYLYSIFLAKMTIIFGGKPHFDDCVICRSKRISNFSILNGGFVCREHNQSEDEYENGVLFKKIYNYDLESELAFDNEKFYLFIAKYYQKLSLANLYNLKKF